MAAPVQIISETRSPRYMIQLRGSDVGDNCLQGGGRAPALGGSSGGRHYVRSKPTRGAVGVDGENLRDPVGKQLGRAFDVP